MNVNAEDLEKACALLPGLFKFLEDGQFFQAVLAVDAENLYFYNDHAPDFKDGDNLQYKVKLRIPHETVDTIFNERIYKQPDLAGLSRLSIMTKEEDIYNFYYYLKDKKAVKAFVSTLKKLKYSVETNKTNLNY